MLKVIIAFVLGVILSGTVLEVWYIFDGASILGTIKQTASSLIEWAIVPIVQTQLGS